MSVLNFNRCPEKRTFAADQHIIAAHFFHRGIEQEKQGAGETRHV